jgi:hypothetical protein
MRGGLITWLEEIYFSSVDGTTPLDTILINHTTFFLRIKALFLFIGVLAFVKRAFRGFLAIISFFFYTCFLAFLWRFKHDRVMHKQKAVKMMNWLPSLKWLYKLINASLFYAKRTRFIAAGVTL